jgi:hypothetical protein
MRVSSCTRVKLHLDVPQLLAQAVQVARQVGERAAELAQPHVQARAADHHFTRLVHQAVQQLRTHAHRLVGRHAQRRELGGCRQAHGRRRWRRCQRLRGRIHRYCRQIDRGTGTHGFERQRHHRVGGALPNGPQGLEVGLQAVKAGLQGLDLVGGDRLDVQLLDGGFEAVGHFAQTHGTRQA